MRMSLRSPSPLLGFAIALGFAVVASLAPAAEIVAHRGASHDAPENTLASVNLGWDQQADGVEIDIRLSKDGQIVLMHDEGTKRTAARDQKIVDQTLDELRQLDAGTWKDPKWAGERIPVLSEVLTTIPDGKRLFIEIKCGPEIVEPLRMALKEAGRPAEQTAVIGFSIEVVEAVKRAMPELQVYWLASIKQDKETGRWGPPVSELLVKAQAAGVDGLDVSGAPVLTKADVELVHGAGLKFLVWTVNDVEVVRRLVEIGVDGITTDRPEWLRERIASESTGSPTAPR
jgi:glycerophosphoryl diester phosphodiesterase